MLSNIKLNKNLILIEKQVSTQQMVDGIIIPMKMTGIISYGKIVAHGGIQESKYSDKHNKDFIGNIKQGKEICYYNSNESQLKINDKLFYLITVMDVVYVS